MNSRSPLAAVTVAVFAAVLFPFAVSIGVSGQDTAASPSADPSPLASASPDPSAAATEGPVSDGVPLTVTVEAGDLWFAPNEISIPSDEPTVLALVGAGLVAHNLIVDELGLQLHVGPGASSEVSVSDLAPGTYQFYCSIFGHRRSGMFGTLTIE